TEYFTARIWPFIAQTNLVECFSTQHLHSFKRGYSFSSTCNGVSRLFSHRQSAPLASGDRLGSSRGSAGLAVSTDGCLEERVVSHRHASRRNRSACQPAGYPAIPGVTRKRWGRLEFQQ